MPAASRVLDGAVIEKPIAPSDLPAFLAQIQERYEQLSERLRRIGRHVLDEPNDLAFETLSVVAERISVQPSAIVRFAQAFGFEGASQMQRLLRDALLRGDSTVGYAERVRKFRHSVPGEVEGPRQLLSEFVEGNILALQNLDHAVSLRDLFDGIDMIERAQTVFVVGFRRSFPVASYLAYLLAQARKRTVLVDGIAGLQAQQTAGLEQGDLLIGISFAPYSPEIVQIVDMAAANDCAIIAISDSVISPIAKQANLVFQVRESEIRGFRSLSASMCLAQALAIGLATRGAEPHQAVI